jgi:hypothetical protein
MKTKVELLKRDKIVDVTFTDFILNSQENLFHSFNHPTNKLLKEYVSQILIMLDMFSGENFLINKYFFTLSYLFLLIIKISVKNLNLEK